MWILALTAAFVGAVHSLSPGHWLPVVMTAKIQRWGISQAALGALSVAMGHILISGVFAALALFLGQHLFVQHEETIEQYSGLLLSVFGLAYAYWAYRTHSRCHGHSHHPHEADLIKEEKKRGPYVFLFSMGFSPCVAVIPVFVAAMPYGPISMVAVFAAFSIGVMAALLTTSVLVTRGLMKFDFLVLEHYGDVITGLGVAVLGVILFFAAPYLHALHGG